MVKRYLTSVGLGFIIWLIFLITMRVIGMTAFTAGNPLLIALYIGAFPIAFVSFWIVRAILNIPTHDMLQPVVIFSIVALFLDGFSIGFTNFYGEGEQRLYSAAFLLWGAGAVLVVSWWLSSRGEANS